MSEFSWTQRTQVELSGVFGRRGNDLFLLYAETQRGNSTFMICTDSIPSRRCRSIDSCSYGIDLSPENAAHFHYGKRSQIGGWKPTRARNLGKDSPTEKPFSGPSRTLTVSLRARFLLPGHG